MVPDPLDVLRSPVVPRDPSPDFTAALRSRIERELTATTGAAMSTTRPYVPERFHAVTPYLSTADTRRAVEFYVEVFDARLLGDPIVMPDGRIGHAEVLIGDSVVMLADGELPDEGVSNPLTLGGTSVQLSLYVENAEAVFDRAVAAGATVLRAVEDQFHGARSGKIKDPFGHNWFIATQIHDAAATPVASPADVGYFTIGAPDPVRAVAFFGALFDWDIEAGNAVEGYHIANVAPPGGIHRSDEPALALYFRVDDVDVAAARVRALGGQVAEPQRYPSGRDADCSDDQGTPFHLWQPAPGY